MSYLTLGTSLSLVVALWIGGIVQTKDQPPTAQSIWEAVIKAKGGRDRLEAVHTLVIQTVELQPRGDSRYRSAVGTIQYELVRAFPDRYWAWDDYRPGSMGFSVEVFNGQQRRNWESRDGKPPTMIPWSALSERGARTILAKDQLVYLLATRWIRPTPTRLEVRSDAIVLDASAPGYELIRYEIDSVTMLPRSITLTPQPVALPDRAGLHPVPPTRYELGRYASVSGIQMPHRVTGLGTVSFVVNPDLDPAIFEGPPTDVTSRDAWRKYLRK